MAPLDVRDAGPALPADHVFIRCSAAPGSTAAAEIVLCLVGSVREPGRVLLPRLSLFLNLFLSSYRARRDGLLMLP